jgi:hypothetical protein
VDASPQSGRRTTQAGEGLPNRIEQLTDPKGRAASQVAIGLGPDELHWIEFGRIGGKAVDMQTRLLSQKILYRLPPMNRRMIPDQNDRATERA